jgi:hypothetical protein
MRQRRGACARPSTEEKRLDHTVGRHGHPATLTSEYRKTAMKWILTYSLVCSGAIGAVLAIAWLFGGFDTEGVSTNGIIAMVLGTTFTVLVGVGLMALIVYSNRSGLDDQ